MACTDLKIRVFGNGEGIEVTDGIAYSIGNQTVDFEIAEDGCECDDPLSMVRINGEAGPVEVCDGEVIAITIEQPEEGDCGLEPCDCCTGCMPSIVTISGATGVNAELNGSYEMTQIDEEFCEIVYHDGSFYIAVNFSCPEGEPPEDAWQITARFGYESSHPTEEWEWAWFENGTGSYECANHTLVDGFQAFWIQGDDSGLEDVEITINGCDGGGEGTGDSCCGDDGSFDEYDVSFIGVGNGTCGTFCSNNFDTPFRVVRDEIDLCKFVSESRSISGCPDLGAFHVELELASGGSSSCRLFGSGIQAGESRWKPDPDDPCNMLGWLTTYAGGGLGFSDNTTRCDFTGVVVNINGVGGSEDCEGCECTISEEGEVECEEITPLFVVSRKVNGKIRISLSKDPMYKKLKAYKKINNRIKYFNQDRASLKYIQENKPYTISKNRTLHLVYNDSKVEVVNKEL